MGDAKRWAAAAVMAGALLLAGCGTDEPAEQPGDSGSMTTSPMTDMTSSMSDGRTTGMTDMTSPTSNGDMGTAGTCPSDDATSTMDPTSSMDSTGSATEMTEEMDSMDTAGSMITMSGSGRMTGSADAGDC